MAALARAAKSKPHEYTKGGGGAKNYQDPPQGKIFSRRQVQQYRAGGITNETAAAVKKAAKTLPKAKAVKAKLRTAGEKFDRLLEAYQQREMLETGKRRSKTAITQDGKFWQALDDLTAPRSTSPTGKKARALEEFGYRPRGAPWKVGQSPKAKKQVQSSTQRAHARVKRTGRDRSKIK